MKKNRVRAEEIRVYMTLAEKNKLRRLANLEEKNMSEYVLNAALSQGLDSSKMDFYLNINQDLITMKRSLLVVTQLLLTICSENLPINKNQVMEFYQEIVQDCEDKF